MARPYRQRAVTARPPLSTAKTKPKLQGKITKPQPKPPAKTKKAVPHVEATRRCDGTQEGGLSRRVHDKRGRPPPFILSSSDALPSLQFTVVNPEAALKRPFPKMSQPPSPPIVFVLGPPGAGKGTLCKRLEQESKGRLRHLSVGDHLRALAEQSPRSSEGLTIARHLARNELMAGAPLVRILERELHRADPASVAAFLVDGFPRSPDQVLESQASPAAPSRPCALGQPALVLSFVCARHEARRRYLARADPSRPHGTPDLFDARHAEFEAHNPAIVRELAACVVEIDVGGGGGEGEAGLQTAYAALLERLGAHDKGGVILGELERKEGRAEGSERVAPGPSSQQNELK